MPAPYFQQFVFIMEDSTIFHVGVFGEDLPHGEGLAGAKVHEKTSSQIWDVCSYPCTTTDNVEFINILIH